jgi:hypothetical protein
MDDIIKITKIIRVLTTSSESYVVLKDSHIIIKSAQGDSSYEIGADVSNYLQSESIKKEWLYSREKVKEILQNYAIIG